MVETLLWLLTVLPDLEPTWQCQTPAFYAQSTIVPLGPPSNYCIHSGALDLSRRRVVAPEKTSASPWRLPSLLLPFSFEEGRTGGAGLPGSTLLFQTRKSVFDKLT